MILVEDSMWPVVAVGWVAESGGNTLDENRLWRGRALLFAVIVPGQGGQAMSAQQEVFEWLERRHTAIRERMCAFAWVIEDDRLRACTESWLSLTAGTAFTRCAAAFRTPREGVSWLLEQAPLSLWPESDTDDAA